VTWGSKSTSPSNEHFSRLHDEIGAFCRRNYDAYVARLRGDSQARRPRPRPQSFSDETAAEVEDDALRLLLESGASSNASSPPPVQHEVEDATSCGGISDGDTEATRLQRAPDDSKEQVGRFQF